MKKVSWIEVGAILGALVVALGAFGAHALKGKLGLYGESIYQKAVLYHMFHTGAILAVGLMQEKGQNTLRDRAGMLFLTGVILFSGSLYLLAITGTRWLGMITPFGGVAFIAGWLFLAFSIRNKKK